MLYLPRFVLATDARTMTQRNCLMLIVRKVTTVIDYLCTAAVVFMDATGILFFSNTILTDESECTCFILIYG